MTVHELIAAEVAKSSERDPSVIAARISMRLSAKDAREALAEVLATYIRVELSRSRMKALAGVADGNKPAATSKWDRHRRLLGEGVFVDGEWKTMADCTAEDFDWLAADRDKRAAEQIATAARFRQHAAEMRAAGVTTFRDLYADAASVAV